MNWGREEKKGNDIHHAQQEKKGEKSIKGDEGVIKEGQEVERTVRAKGLLWGLRRGKLRQRRGGNVDIKERGRPKYNVSGGFSDRFHPASLEAHCSPLSYDAVSDTLR